MTRLIALAAVAAFVTPATAEDFKPLFNGKDFTGWDLWQGRPHRSVEGLDIPKDKKGNYTKPVGVNVNAKDTYTVVAVDGKPAIRISGEIFGALTTKEEYGDYHLKFQFKWGQAKWKPRDRAKRDSGLLYHCFGPIGGQGNWAASFECQVQEGDCGDYFGVGPVMAEIPCVKIKRGHQYKPGVELKTIPRYCKKLTTNENDGWNTIELYTVGQTAVHVVNGKPVMVLKNTRHRGSDKAITKGKIQFQSEGAEVFYRNIEVAPLKEIPAELLK